MINNKLAATQVKGIPYHKIRKVAEEVKVKLSTVDTCSVAVVHSKSQTEEKETVIDLVVYDGDEVPGLPSNKGTQLDRITITRGEFETSIQDILQRCMDIVKNVFNDVKMAPDKVTYEYTLYKQCHSHVP